MALTRPSFTQLTTTITSFTDPITVLNQGASNPTVDVGFLFNRANGLVSNVALFWSESAQSFVTAYTSNTGITNTNVAATSYANIKTGNITVNGIFWANGAVFSSGGGGTAFTGGYVANQTTFGANLVANSGVASTSTTTGALVVSGGAGIAGQVSASNISLVSGYPTTVFTSTVSSRTSTIGFKDGYNMFLDAANGGYLLLSTSGAFVGIANTAPAHNLAVTGTAYISGKVTAGNVVTTSGVFWSNGAAYSSGGGGGTGLTYTASSSAPVSPNRGDIWYNTTTDVIYTYTYDGVSSYWVDLESAPTLSTVSADAAGTAVIMGIALG